MILPFSTQLNGKPTYFVEKILKTFDDKILTNEDKELIKLLIEFEYLDVFKYDEVKPKIHTIREDKKDRWKAGNKIDFFINSRRPDMFRFCHTLKVISIQKVEIYYFPLTTPRINVPVLKVDGKLLYDAAGINKKEMLEFANNDGFESIEDFFNYFNEDFTGKIIHWTDKKY